MLKVSASWHVSYHSANSCALKGNVKNILLLNLLIHLLIHPKGGLLDIFSVMISYLSSKIICIITMKKRICPLSSCTYWTMLLTIPALFKIVQILQNPKREWEICVLKISGQTVPFPWSAQSVVCNHYSLKWVLVDHFQPMSTPLLSMGKPLLHIFDTLIIWIDIVQHKLHIAEFSANIVHYLILINIYCTYTVFKINICIWILCKYISS